MIQDFDQLDEATLECDLCIVGSGPVGLSMAMQFLHTTARVKVLESGGDGHEAAAEALSAFECAGQRRVQPSAVRRRIFGGTSTIWSGRCMPFSRLDLQSRNWMADSGWPVDSEEIAPWLQRAGRILQSGPAIHDDRIWALLAAAPGQPWDASRFETQVFQASVVRHPRSRHVPAPADSGSEGLGALNHSGAPQAEDMGEYARQSLVAAANIRVLLHAHATEVCTDDTGTRAEAVKFGSLGGRRGCVRARHVVLACGAIDNARLLLLSRSRYASGLGNGFDQVGRRLADHHYAAVASITGSQARRLRRRMGYLWLDVGHERHVYTTGVSLSAQRQREEQLPRATLFLHEHVSRPPAIAAARRIAAGLLGGNEKARAGDWQAAALHPLELLEGVADRYLHSRPALARIAALEIGCNVEQVPDPESRVTLGSASDAFGQPLARIDWRMHDREYQGYCRAGALFTEECRRLGLEVPELSPWIRERPDDWRRPLHDMAHPMCTTRMSADPRHGVVDANCQVHGIEGLHVAGSSVFSTGGTSNPTLMAVALGLRLADRIRRESSGVPFVAAGKGVIEPLSGPRLRVGIIGAGSRVSQVYAPVLAALAGRFEVAGATSRSSDSRARLQHETGWPVFASAQELVASARPDFLVVAVNGNANVAMLHAALGFGLPVLAETPLAWNERDGRGIVSRARAMRVPVGIAEQFPFLPVEQLKRKAISLGAIGAVTAAINDFASYDYHGLAQLRAYAGYGQKPASVLARRFRFGRTGVPEGGQPASPELGWPEEWMLGTILLSGGTLLAHNFSPGYAVLPTRPQGELRVLGQCGSLVNDSAVFVDRTSGTRTEAGIERSATSVGISHPQLGRIEWRHPLLAGPPGDEQVAVAQHIEAFAAVVREGEVPLYSAAEALEDVELLRALYYSAENDGVRVRMPLRTGAERARLAAGRIARRLRLRK